jgi:hypothetical protein
MAPVQTVTRQQIDLRAVPVPALPILDLLFAAAKEIVVDWQMPSDAVRKS